MSKPKSKSSKDAKKPVKAAAKSTKNAKPGKAGKAAAPKAAAPKAAAPKAAAPKAAAPKAAAPKAAAPKAAASKAAKGASSKAGKVAPSKSSGGKASPSKDAPGEQDAGANTGAAALNPKRKLGLRGAAPWAARHAAKHAAEARARAMEPAPPGSARATIRTPTGAEAIKQQIADLHNQTTRIKALRKRYDKGFYEIGEVLSDIQHRELFRAKGYGSFETFLEREVDLGKSVCVKLMKIPTVFQKEVALDYGMDRLFSALLALEGELIPRAIPSAPGSKPGLPMKPPSRMIG
jgi:hypothetical protein